MVPDFIVHTPNFKAEYVMHRVDTKKKKEKKLQKVRYIYQDIVGSW